MFLATIVFSLAVAASNSGSAVPLDAPPALLGATRIVNGENAKPGEIPFQVSLQRASDSFHFCGGSLLNPNYIITAAHCVKSQIPKNLVILAGTNDLLQGGVRRNVTAIKVHEGYNVSDSYRNDIALLKLSKPLNATSLVDFVRLPNATQTVRAGEQSVVSGWGRLVEGGSSPRFLQKVAIQVSDQNYCKEIYRAFGMIVDETQVCADVPEGDKGSCHGDSGGPLTVRGVLTGLVSWANGCARKGFPTVYTKVSKYLSWIEKNAV